MKEKCFFVFLLCVGLYGCKKTVEPKEMNYNACANVTFMKNTLDYPVLVQSYFHKFNDSANFCQKEPIAWSEPILIQPSEYQLIMDYVIPQRIKIFDIDTVLIVDIKCGWNSTGEKINLVKNILRINETEARKLDNSKENDNFAGFFHGYYYLKDDRYLTINVPWGIYPIDYDTTPCAYMSKIDTESDKNRKEEYNFLSNGYAVIQFLETNPNADCFNP